MNSVRKQSTTGMAKEHEEFVADLFSWANGRRSRSSGASFHDPIVVTTDVTVTECEATENQSYRLRKDFWKEIIQKQHSGKNPTLAIRFIDKPNQEIIDLMVIDAGELAALYEEVEALRTIAVRRNG